MMFSPLIPPEASIGFIWQTIEYLIIPLIYCYQRTAIAKKQVQFIINRTYAQEKSYPIAGRRVRVSEKAS